MSHESYIQYAGGYSKENITTEDIRQALRDLHKMDYEHGAFWVSVIKNRENVLETHKDLKVIGIFEDDLHTELRKQCKDAAEIHQLYSLLLNENFAELKEKLKSL